MKKAFVVLALSAVLFALSLPVSAQQAAKVVRIGYLTGTGPDAQSARLEAFRQGLRELGYVEGKNIVIEPRYAEGKIDRRTDLVADLLRLKLTSSLPLDREIPVLPSKPQIRYP
jgi:putative ABC transport system substrate-binding protein